MPSSIKVPVSGITSMPVGESTLAYPDMEAEKLLGSIETEGARFAWSRASNCPCVGVNSQTDQPDPNCTLCIGNGVFYFGPTGYEVGDSVGTLDEVQKAITTDAAIIRGIVANPSVRARKMITTGDLADVFGHWQWGTLVVSVRPENKIGYYDRLVSIDSEMCYFEHIDVQAGDTEITLRYRTTGVNLIRSLDTIFEQGIDYDVAADGTVTWITPPTSSFRIVVHYLFHPAWRIIEHPHIIREIGRRQVPDLISPLGTPTSLPIQALIRLEFQPLGST